MLRMTSRKARCVALSVVLAVRDAEETVGSHVRRIASHLRGRGVPFEILAVNDGCCDNSLAMLRLLQAEIPELRLCAGRGPAYLRGTADAQGDVVILCVADGTLPLATLGWALERLAAGCDAVVFRGRCIVARRLRCLATIVRSRGAGDVFEWSFERNAHLGDRPLIIELIGARRRLPGLLDPVFRFLAA